MSGKHCLYPAFDHILCLLLSESLFERSTAMANFSPIEKLLFFQTFYQC